MQVLSIILSPLTACWKPKASEPLRIPDTTRDPKAPGQWMDPDAVNCIRVRYYPADGAHAEARHPASASMPSPAVPPRSPAEPTPATDDAVVVRPEAGPSTAVAAPPAPLHPPKIGRTCVVHNFKWADPASNPPQDIQAYYASRIAREGVVSGWLEAEVLGEMLGVRIGIWDRPYGKWFRWLSTQGATDPNAPLVHLVNLGNVHWCALVPPKEPTMPWWQIDAGGEGNCLFHALNAAIEKHPEASAPPKATALRQACATELAHNSDYQERIVTLSHQAWAEWQALPMWRRVSNRIIRRVQHMVNKRAQTP